MPRTVPALAVAAVMMLASAGGPSAAVRPPKLQYDISKLDNGLTVILSEDHSTPIVHVALWYHVGSKNERPGRTGFAHLFEHMMFKGSKSRARAHLFISSVGGQTNAYTTDDDRVLGTVLAEHAAGHVVSGRPHGVASHQRVNVYQ
jgi:zinc protease